MMLLKGIALLAIAGVTIAQTASGSGNDPADRRYAMGGRPPPSNDYYGGGSPPYGPPPSNDYVPSPPPTPRPTAPACYESESDCPGPQTPLPCELCAHDYAARPQSLTIEITGGAPRDTYQGGDGYSTGDTIATDGPYTVACGGQSQTVENNDNVYTFTISPASDSLTCEVTDSDSQTQTITFHLSCYRRLRSYVNYGALRIVDYVLNNGTPAPAVCTTYRDAPVCQLCCVDPPLIIYPAQPRFINKVHCVNGSLPRPAFVELSNWYEENAHAQCVSTNFRGDINWNISAGPRTPEEFENLICTATSDYCPELLVSFDCCDLCDASLPCETVHASFEIGFEDQQEIDEFCNPPDPPPPPTPCVPQDVDVCPASEDGMGMGGRPESLQIEYRPGTTFSDNQNNNVQITGSVSGTVTISCDEAIASPNTVAEGQTFTLFPSGDRFEANTMCVLNGEGQQTIRFHTSCSQPLFTGSFFGSFLIVGSGGVVSNGCPTPPIPPPPPPPPTPAPPPQTCDVCEVRGRPQALTFQITGGGTAGSIQGGKGSISGVSLSNTGPYTIDCGDEAAVVQTTPSMYTIRDLQGSNTECAITSSDGIQTIDLHTSCSVELITGQVFGGVMLVAFVNSAGSSNCGGGGGGSTGMSDSYGMSGNDAYYRDYYPTNNYNSHYYNPNPIPPPPPSQRQCNLCCVVPPELVIPPPIELPKIKRCVNNTVPEETRVVLDRWLAMQSCRTQQEYTLPAFDSVRVRYEGATPLTFIDFTVDNLIEVICEAENPDTDNDEEFINCPELQLEFACCDPCRPIEGFNPHDEPESGLCVVGNSSVSIVDNNPPMITTNDKSVKCNDTTNAAQYQLWLQSETYCTDRESPDETWYRSSPHLVSRVTTNDTSCLKYRTLEWKCTDECGNEAIPITSEFVIRDLQAPVILIPPRDLTVDCSEVGGSETINEYLSNNGYANAEDCNDIIVTNSESYSGDVSDTCPKEIDVTFTFTDECGNSANASAKITITDNEPPTITCPVDDCETNRVIECDRSSDFNIQSWLNRNADLSCTDECGLAGSLLWQSPRLVDEISASDGCGVTYTYEFACTDACGNTGLFNASIQTVDTEGPQYTTMLPTDKTFECTANLNITEKFDSFVDRWLGGANGVRWANDECKPNPRCNEGSYRMMSDKVYAQCTYCSNASDPVCADGVTYPNNCYAYCNGQYSFTSGPCADDITTKAPATTDAQNLCSYCSSEYNPVCVAGSLEFPNFCHAYCNNYFHFAVGSCTIHYPDLTTNPGYPTQPSYQTTQAPYVPTVPTCYALCGSYISYVCGSNGQTYNSACHAQCDNVYSYYSGQCTENCGEDPLEYTYTHETTPLPCTPTEVTFYATDPCNGESISTTATFDVADTTAPEFHTKPQDSIVECDGLGNIEELQTWLQSSAGTVCSDSCIGPVVPSIVSYSQSWMQNGVNKVCGTDCPYDRCMSIEVECRDTCGNYIIDTAQFTIVDTTPPELNVTTVTVDECIPTENLATRWAIAPLDAILNAEDVCNYCNLAGADPSCQALNPVVTATLNYGQSQGQPFILRDGFFIDLPKIPNGGVIGVGPAMLSDPIRQLIIDETSLDLNPNDRCPLITKMEVQATDACGNEGSIEKIYHVLTDETPPIFTALPQDLTVDCSRRGDENEVAFQAWLASSAGAECEDSCAFGPVTISYDSDSILFSQDSCPQQKIVQFTCEDYCGNQVTENATFEIQDVTPPEIPEIKDKTIECSVNPETRYEKWYNGLVTNTPATDDCSRNAQLGYSIRAGALQPVPGAASSCSDERGNVVLSVNDTCGNVQTENARFYIIDTQAPKFTSHSVKLSYTCDMACSNRNEIAQALYTKWLGENGCAEFNDCQEEIIVNFENGPADLLSLCDSSGTVDLVVTDGCGNSANISLEYDFGLRPFPPPPPPPPPPHPCNICDRDGYAYNSKPELTSLTFRWNSNGAPATLTIDSPSLDTTLQNGDEATLAGSFGTNTDISVNSVEVTFHTSCSRPIYLYQDIAFPTGNLTIVGFQTSNGRTDSVCPPPPLPPPPPVSEVCEYNVTAVDVCNCIPQPPPPPPPPQDVCEGYGRPRQLTFAYIGGSELTNGQGGKASLSGGVAVGTASVITCTSGGGGYDSKGGIIQTYTNVAIGDTIVVGSGASELPSAITCQIDDVQTVEIHTSCSAELFTGDVFGSLRLVCFQTGSQNVCVDAQSNSTNCGEPLPPPYNLYYNAVPTNPYGGSGYNQGNSVSCDVCSDNPNSNAYARKKSGSSSSYGSNSGGYSSGGKPRPSVLAFRYIGGIALTNSQDGKASVAPMTSASGQAQIQCSGMAQPMTLAINGEFIIGNAGYQLPTEVTCTIQSNGGSQYVQIHTSCSANLRIGDIFGSIVLISFSRTDGLAGSESAICPAAGGVPPPPPPPPPTAEYYDDDVFGGDDDDMDDDYSGYTSDDDCEYLNPCEAIDENGGELKAITFQFIAANGQKFDNSQKDFGIQQPYTVSGGLYATTRVKVGGSVRNSWMVADGDLITVDAGNGRLPNQLSFLIGAGSSAARIKFQVNCKRDFAVGDIFGVLKIVGFRSTVDECASEVTRTASLAVTGEGNSGSGSSLSGETIAGGVVGCLMIIGTIVGVYSQKTKPSASYVDEFEASEPSSVSWDIGKK